MTNEELAILIKNGDDGLLPQLWDQVRKYVTIKATQYHRAFEGSSRCDQDDLIQEGYFAVCEAIKYYSPEKGLKFTTFLSNTLKNAFRNATGIRTSKRDTLFYSTSLDAPIGDDGDMTLLDTIGDMTPGKIEVEQEVIISLWNMQLRSILNEAMDNVLSKKQKELLEFYYYFGLSLEKIAEMRFVSKQAVCDQHYKALKQLYDSRYRRDLSEFLFFYEPDPYKSSGLSAYENNGCSSAERFLINIDARSLM